MIKALVFILLSILFPYISNAETHLKNSYFNSNTAKITLSESNSPYILDEYMTLPKNKILIIENGVTIMSASSSLAYDNAGIDILGSLIVNGTGEKPVNFLDTGYMYFGNSTSTITYASFVNTPIELQNSRLDIKNSKISKSKEAIILKNSSLFIDGTDLTDNVTGITSYPTIPVYQVKESNMVNNNIGGLGNVYNEDPVQNIIVVNNSSFTKNQKAIVNKTTNTIDARDNWWGNASGPGDTVSGYVAYDPWKKDAPLEKSLCCSSVLFLPGIEASRLYLDGKNILIGTTTNDLWEPFTKYDFEKLHYDEYGNPINKGIYTKDIIDSIHGLSGIYKNIIAMFDSMVADHKINEWLPYAYDWRKSVDDVVSNGTDYATTTKYLIDEAINLAKRSKTGKITIVAHSNGGLVAKMLGKELEKIGRVNIIEKVVMVAVPELGTPESIPSLLHGVSEYVLGLNVVKGYVTRSLAIGLPGVYGLLPSSEYFTKIIEPIVTFTSKKFLDIDFSGYKNEVSTYSALVDFLTGSVDKREKPTLDNTLSPELLQSKLISKAKEIHDYIDGWSFPIYTKVLSIIGWGSPTTESLKYTDKEAYKMMTMNGDGTVVNTSSENNNSKIYLNQADIEKQDKKKISHANIIESESVDYLVKSAVESVSTTSSMINGPLPKYTSYEKPNIDDYKDIVSLQVGIHSPVNLDIYDSKGQHAGPKLVELPKHPGRFINIMEDNIGSTYYTLGDDKYFILHGGDTYKIKLSGTDVGIFTLDFRKQIGGKFVTVASTTYSNIPVTDSMEAFTTISASDITPNLNMDIDGDGVIDMILQPKDGFDLKIHITYLSKLIDSLNIGLFTKKKLHTKLSKLEKYYDKHLNENTTDNILKEMKHLEGAEVRLHKIAKILDRNDLEYIKDYIEKMIDLIDEAYSK